MNILGKTMIRDHLTEQEIIRLHREFAVPMAVHDVMRGDERLDETTRYTMDVMISELPVDAALLCVALSAAHLAHDLAPSHPIARALAAETGRMVHEYGPAWIAHADGQLSGRQIEAVQAKFTDSMAEDFESLADLLDASADGLPAEGDHAVLCDLLSVQARSYAAYVTAMLDDGIAIQAELPQAGDSAAKIETIGNIVVFPGAPKPF